MLQDVASENGMVIVRIRRKEAIFQDKLLGPLGNCAVETLQKHSSETKLSHSRTRYGKRKSAKQ